MRNAAPGLLHKTLFHTEADITVRMWPVGISHLVEELPTLHFFNKRLGLLRPSQVTSLRIKCTLSLGQQKFTGTQIPFRS